MTEPEESRSGRQNVSDDSLSRSFLTIALQSLLLPIATVSLIYGHNADRIRLDAFLYSAAFLVISYFLIVLILRMVFRGKKYTDTIVGCLYIGAFMSVYFIPGQNVLCAIIWLGAAIAVVFHKPARATIGFLVTSIGVAFAIAGLYLLLSSMFLDRIASADAAKHSFDVLPVAGSDINTKRDIYYIVLDRYANADQLQEVYQFDNSGFLDELKRRGFVIPQGAYSNYPRTAHSLSSSMNLEYLEPLGKDLESPSGDWLPIYRTIEQSAVAKFFKHEGYAFTFLGSWWEPTRKNSLADTVINYRAWPELLRVVFENSLAGYLADKFEIAAINPRQLQCERAKIKFAEISKIAGSHNQKHPKFVFAHFLVPHPPFVLGADGTCLSIETVEGRTREQNYIEQVRYANRQILRFLDHVKETGGLEPIIILQSDEGPWPKKYVLDEVHYLGRDVTNVSWDKVTPGELREKMGILNALYLPGLSETQVVTHSTPVNNLRFVLREYFGADLPQLPDRSYIFSNNEDLYRFHEVDQKLQTR
ncbi:MAG: sulfatase-like hydrolase/transferase [Rhizobiaceae bacterium]